MLSIPKCSLFYHQNYLLLLYYLIITEIRMPVVAAPTMPAGARCAHRAITAKIGLTLEFVVFRGDRGVAALTDEG